MKMVNDLGHAKMFEGSKGEAVITRNYGNCDKKDYWSVAVRVNGKYKKLATRTDYTKAVAMAEAAIA